MNKISELKSILGESFTWNKARLDCFARMLIALFAVRTVNLSELGLALVQKQQKNVIILPYSRFAGLNSSLIIQTARI